MDEASGKISQKKEKKALNGKNPGVSTAELRGRLDAARKRMLNRGTTGTHAGGVTNLEEATLVESSSPETFGYAADEFPQMEREPGLEEAETQRKKVRKLRVRKLRRQEGREPIPNTGSGQLQLRDARNEAPGALVATSAGTSRNFQGQLLAKAREVSRAQHQLVKETRKKDQQKNPALQLAKLLSQVASGGKSSQRSASHGNPNPSSSSKVKKEKKGQKLSKKKRKAGHPGGGDPGDSDGSYQTESWDGNPNDDLEEDSSSSEARQRRCWGHCAGNPRPSLGPCCRLADWDSNGCHFDPRSEDQLLLCHRGEGGAGECNGPDPGTASLSAWTC